VQVASLGNGPAIVTTGVARRDAPDNAGQTASQTPDIKYPSPQLKYDPQSRLVIFQVLNPETGDVVRQYPSQRVVKLYQDGSDLNASSALATPIPGIVLDSDKSKSSATSSTTGGTGQPDKTGATGAEGTPAAGEGHAAPASTGGSVKIEA
jgi:hypothetical protein